MPIAKTRLETLQICKLLQCVRQGDKEQARKLTVSGVPHLINYNDATNGDTALSVAATANNDDMIEFLLELGAHPDVVDRRGRSAIMRAAEYGHVQCVEKLCTAGADLKLKDVDGKGVLFHCISPTQRHEKCMEICLEHGAEVNNKSNSGLPVFLCACEAAQGSEQVCMLMLQKGAEPNSRDATTRRTALMGAAASGSVAVTRAMLQKGADVNEMTTRTRTHAAHEAAKGGHIDVLKVLAAYGANFDQIDDQGNSPIHYAARGGHGPSCRFLSQRGCNPKPRNKEGLTARLVAKEEGQKDALKECRKAEKSFGKYGKNNDPWALLLYDFSCERRDNLMEVFQKFDADSIGGITREDFVDALENIGAPMPEEHELKKILTAHDKGKEVGIDYVEFLTGKKYINKLYLLSAFDGKKKTKKKKGAGRKKKGKTKIAMPICTQSAGPRCGDGGPPEILVPKHMHFTDWSRYDRDRPPAHPLQDDSAWYLQHPDKTYTNVNEAAKHGDLDTLAEAFQTGTLVDVRDKYFKTPLMVASCYGNMKVCKFLVERGAQVNATDNFNWTPLHFACHAGMLDIAEYLLDHNANPDAPTLNGATPLMRAIESSKPQVVQLIIDKGAKMRAENRKGQTAMDIAGLWGDARVYDIVKAKWDTLPPPPNEKKGKGKKQAAKRPSSSPLGHSTQAAAVGGTSPGVANDPPPRQRKGSILRTASALAGGIETEENITYTPLKVWTDQPNTEDLLQAKQSRRERYGWEVDFENFQMPFLKNVSNKVAEQGGLDDE